MACLNTRAIKSRLFSLSDHPCIWLGSCASTDEAFMKDKLLNFHELQSRKYWPELVSKSSIVVAFIPHIFARTWLDEGHSATSCHFEAWVATTCCAVPVQLAWGSREEWGWPNGWLCRGHAGGAGMLLAVLGFWKWFDTTHFCLMNWHTGGRFRLRVLAWISGLQYPMTN